jgi:hypothetical protein
MNILLSSLAIIVAIIVSFCPYAYVVSQYDSDGFTIFHSSQAITCQDKIRCNSSWQRHTKKFNDSIIHEVEANQDHIKCPKDTIGDMCLGYKDGYADEAMDQLE